MDLVRNLAPQFEHQIQVLWVEEWWLDTPQFLDGRYGMWHGSHATLPQLSPLLWITTCSGVLSLACRLPSLLLHGRFQPL
jgi:hypothetical protein